MTDADTIQTAYADTLTELFAVFFEALTDSRGNAQADAVARSRFAAGIALARKARDQALQLVQ